MNLGVSVGIWQQSHPNNRLFYLNSVSVSVALSTLGWLKAKVALDSIYYSTTRQLFFMRRASGERAAAIRVGAARCCAPTPLSHKLARLHAQQLARFTQSSVTSSSHVIWMPPHALGLQSTTTKQSCPIIMRTQIRVCINDNSAGDGRRGRRISWLNDI